MTTSTFYAKLKWGNGDRCKLPQSPVRKTVLKKEVA
jgi:hypothetical protein